MENGAEHYGIVIMAGGQSRRLGTPKQLLSFRENTLLGYTIEVALSAQCGPVLVVLGSGSQIIRAAIEAYPVVVVENEGWEEGMGSSLRVGLQEMLKIQPDTDAIIFMVCDQPFVTKSLLLCLISTQVTTGKGITASGYLGKMGTPALFQKKYFGELMELKGDTGARILLKEYDKDVVTIPFEAGITDIDTKQDYERLMN